MTLTLEQQQLVQENMGLVGKVIGDKVHGIGTLHNYDDLFQTGCIGLCKAATTDKGGCFSTYAYRLIWNEICDELIRNTRRRERELILTAEEIRAAQDNTDLLGSLVTRQAIRQAQKNTAGTIAKGIDCLTLLSNGYSSREIGDILVAEAPTVRMWMSRARRYLRDIPELQEQVV